MLQISGYPISSSAQALVSTVWTSHVRQVSGTPASLRLSLAVGELSIAPGLLVANQTRSSGPSPACGYIAASSELLSITCSLVCWGANERSGLILDITASRGVPITRTATPET
jgi:hypothetical protein